jgi:hypothetical protein
MIQAVIDGKEMLWHIQNILRSSESGASWTYVDGQLAAGSPHASAAEWENTLPAAIDNDSFVILQAPGLTSLGGADAGVMELKLVGGTVLEFRAHTGGWDPASGLTGAPKPGSVELGDPSSVEMDEANVEAVHVIANPRRAIFVFRGAALATFNIFYFGAIQTFYADSDDSNAILVAGHEARVFGDDPAPPASMLKQDGTEGGYIFNSDVFPGADPAKNLLTDCQPNRRILPVKRVGIPAVVGCDDGGNEEIRGELEGVFYYGEAGGLSVDTAVIRDDGTYVVMHSGANSIVCGPI